MNKGDLIRALETKLGSRKAATDGLEAVLDVIIREVAKGGKVGITGFGTFEKVARAARTGRNPRTGAPVKIRGTHVPRFKAGTSFKEVVADPRKLPKATLAGGRAAAKAAAPAKKAVTAKKAAPARTATAAKTTASAKKVVATKAAAKTPVTKAAPARTTTAAKKATATKAPAKRTAKKA